MPSLFLDLASHAGLIAVVTHDAVIAEHTVDQRIRDHELVPLAEDLLRKAGGSGPDLTGIACCIGPGGFTSIRVAVACANAWSFAWGVPLAGMHLSDLWKARTPEEDLLWLHSTKKSEVFVRGFGRHSSQWREPTHEAFSSLMERLPAGATWMGELLPAHEEHCAKMACSRAESKFLLDVLPAYLPTLPFSHTLLEPWYGREG